MPDLAAIAGRLELALTRIEGAIEANLLAAKRNDSGAGAPAAAGVEVEALKGECDLLRGELETIRTEHAALRRLADTVSGRLDKAIEELQAALEG